MPEQAKTILKLYYYEELTLGEISTVVEAVSGTFPREVRLLGLIHQGLRNQEIAPLMEQTLTGTKTTVRRLLRTARVRGSRISRERAACNAPT
jgi:ATP/maltotriose-dependent transcriptional regulator MalT